MQNKLDNIPLEMRERRQWVCANYDKKPLIVFNGRAGEGASVTEPNDWGTFEDAVDLWQSYPNIIMGIGFVLTKDDPYVIIDFDDKPEKPAPEGARAWFGQAAVKLGCYVEKSISGYGFHAFLKGDFPRGVKGHGFEMYGHERYILITGDMVQAGPMVHDQEFIESLAELIETNRPNVGGSKYEFNELVAKRDDDRVMRHLEALNKNLFSLYQTGDWQGYFQHVKPDARDKSQSVADLAVVQALCSCTDSDEQVLRLWRRSPLDPHQRKEPSKKKPKPEDYMRRTIGLARAHVANDRASVPVMDFSSLSKNAKANWEPPPPAPPPPPPPTPLAPPPVPTAGPFPPGLLGDIARYIYRVAPRPIEDLAMAAAISYMAGICGRTYNVSAQGLNQYVLVVANSGIGKEGMKHGIDSIQSAVSRISNHAGKFIGPSNFTTGAAVQKHLETEPCCLSLFTEFGQMLVRFNSQRDEHGKLLKAALLSAYTKSGFQSVMDKAKYSKDENSIESIKSPNLSILAEGTQSTVFDNLPMGSILDGFLPRFLCIEYTGERPPLNEHLAEQPPPQLVSRVAELMERAEQARQGKQVMDGPGAGMLKERPYTGEDVSFNAEAESYRLDFIKRIDAEYNALDSEGLRALNSRLYLTTLKLAALCAVGCNFYGPVITLPILQWAEKLARRSHDTFASKLQKGDIGGNAVGKREQVIIDIARDFILNGASPSYFTKNVDIKALRANACVTYDYIRRRVRMQKAYADDGVFGGSVLKAILTGLQDAEVLVPIAAAEAKERFGVSNVLMLMRPD